MDIPTKEWIPEKKYSVDDIVRVWNLALPPYLDPENIKDEDYFAGKYVSKIGDDEKNYLLTDNNEYIATEVSRGEIFEQKTISNSSEISFGLKFQINPNIGYTAKALIRKNSESSDTKDPFITRLLSKNNKIDTKESVGVGVGIKFYNSNLNYIEPENQRMTVRPLASSELSDHEWYKAQLDIEPKFIPKNAEVGEVFVFVYGADVGGFEFRDVEATNLNKFFYCIKDNQSSIDNIPGGSDFWTQDFHWRPSYGSNSNFAAINESMELGEGSDYINNLAINSLPLELDVSFKNRTDKQTKAIIHFLQEKHFPYESIFALDYKGNRLLSSDVQAFNFQYTHPYRKDLKFTCVDFSHSIEYRNNNTVSAKFICNTESSIKSVDSHSGYNPRIDAVFPVYIDQKTEFIKGQKIRLHSFSLEDVESKSSVSLNGLIEITPYGDTNDGVPQAGLLTFDEDQDLKVGDSIYINVSNPEDSIYSVGISKIFKVINNKQFVFGIGKGYVDGVLDSRLLSEGSIDNAVAPIEIKKLLLNCLAYKPLLPDTECGKKVNHKVIDPVTGNNRKRIVFLKNYRQVQLESDIDEDTVSIDITPLSSFTLEKEDDFQILIPAVCGRSSIYIEDADRIPKYPWLKIRNFEQRPSLAFNINHKPKHLQSNFLNFYNKKYKKSINQNMSTFNVVFDKRDDEEAAEILQFLESHLGYKKFRFTMPRPYLGDSSELTTQSRPFNSVFYCPSWSHQLVYKNNHTITATFVESATGLQENFGDPESPCYGAKVYNPVTTHSVCTFSSVAQAKLASFKGDFNQKGEMNLSKKSTDIVFIVDATGSMTGLNLSGNGFSYSKYSAAIDVIRKMVMAYDDFIMPGTFEYGGAVNAPQVLSESEPPWPVKSENGSLVSLIDPSSNDIPEDLRNQGYDTSNLDRFMIKAERSRVNFGFLLMGHNGNTIIDLSSGLDNGDSFDKKRIYDNLTPWVTAGVSYGQGEYFTDAISKALAQLYNSKRAEDVSERIIVMLSDGVTFTGDNTQDGAFFDRYSPSSLKICEQLRFGGELVKRRPLDDVLAKSEYSHGAVNPFQKITAYGIDQNNPDLGGMNPSWYHEDVPTTFMFAQMGNPNYMSKHNPKYVYDYNPDENESPEFFFDISDKNGTNEVNRLLSLIKAVAKITSETGYENIFSITVKNCGPHPIRILNSIVNLKNEASELKWTTEVLLSGIPKDGNYRDIQKIPLVNGIDNIKKGYGGQYARDPNNRSFLGDEAFGDEQDDVLWESFNTEYEVIRDNKVYEINGGWSRDKLEYKLSTDQSELIQLDSGEILLTDKIGFGEHKTEGVLNTGVAFRGMPVRVFTSEKGLSVIDYNIGGIDTSDLNEDPKGNYDHIPVLEKNEMIDLFFGVRASNLNNIGDEIEIIFNTEDHTKRKMDCYARVTLPFNIDSVNYQE